jgi:hypothetical protein
MLRTGDEANVGDPSARRKTCKLIRTMSLSCSAESPPSTRHRRRLRTLKIPARMASLSVLPEVNGVAVGSAVGAPANDANDADWPRRVKSLTLEIVNERARQGVWVDQLTALVRKRINIDAGLP